MDQQTSAIFKSDQIWINLCVGGEVYPVQLKTLLNPSTCGNWFKDRVNKSTDYIIKVACIQWDSSPNHIKYRLDIDRYGKIFRMVLQFLRNGKKTALPDDKFTLHELMLVVRSEDYGIFNHVNRISPRARMEMQHGRILPIMLTFDVKTLNHDS